jgi:hypothetical protein
MLSLEISCQPLGLRYFKIMDEAINLEGNTGNITGNVIFSRK